MFVLRRRLILAPVDGRSRIGGRWTVSHGVTVLVLMAAAWSATATAADASIGGGLLLLCLMLLGLPWSLVPLLLVQPEGVAPSVLAYGACALLDVVLVDWQRRRSAS